MIQYLMVLETLPEGLNQKVVYLEFRNAFDKVDHLTLFKMVSNLGVRVNLLL